ncbi:hypothetical protein [Thermomonospora cellulosilytica]|uniref:Uncharacterized protein n=1 Tax=Thermomonospora cellulosilytica TaxID=1411118 RepID=A0A7W3R712_9ACTN|nr:hypothetical protein [Thermomonospora cellulosilytica]MBA9001994.1 hypothetical protein [Thermomonospora cellulosilytica]
MNAPETTAKRLDRIEARLNEVIGLMAAMVDQEEGHNVALGRLLDLLKHEQGGPDSDDWSAGFDAGFLAAMAVKRGE